MYNLLCTTEHLEQFNLETRKGQIIVKYYLFVVYQQKNCNNG